MLQGLQLDHKAMKEMLEMNAQGIVFKNSDQFALALASKHNTIQTEAVFNGKKVLVVSDVKHKHMSLVDPTNHQIIGHVDFGGCSNASVL